MYPCTRRSRLFACLFSVCLMQWHVQSVSPVFAAPVCIEQSTELIQKHEKALIRNILLRDRNGSISIEIAGALQDSQGKSQLQYVTPRSVCEDLRRLNLSVPQFTARLAQEQQAREKKASAHRQRGIQKQGIGQKQETDRFAWQQRLFQKEERLVAELKQVKVQERLLQKERQRLKEEWEAVEKAKQWVTAQHKRQTPVSLLSENTPLASQTSEDSSLSFVLVLLLLGGGGAWHLRSRKAVWGNARVLTATQHAPNDLEEIEDESADESDPILSGGVDPWDHTEVVQAEGLTHSSSLRKKTTVAASSRILIVEDSAVEQKILERILTKLNYKTEIVSSGTAALVAIAQKSYCAIFMDCQLPEINGFELTQRIRQQEKLTDTHVPIIAVTAQMEEGGRELCLAAGMDDYVPKPVDAEVLTEVLMDWIPERSER